MIFHESHATSPSSKTRSFGGCHLFIITHECGKQILTMNIKIQSDLASYSQVPAVQLQVSLTSPLASLIMQVPALEGLPLYDSLAEAGVKLLKEVTKKLLHSSRIRKVNQLVELARLFASDMQLLKPLTKGFSQCVPFKLSFTLTVIVFVVSTVLHMLFMFAYHKFHLSERLFSIVVKADNRKIAVKPHVHVPEEQLIALPALEQNVGHRFRFPQRIAVPVAMNPGTPMAQSVNGNAPT